jgi:peptide/nickel transport system permease protein
MAVTLATPAAATKKRSPRRKTVTFGFALGFIVLVALAVVVPGWLGAGDPSATDPLASFLPPGSPSHLLGTDQLGRDVYSLVVHGAHDSISISVLAVVMAVVIGLGLGLWAGLGGKIADEILARAFDLTSAFPSVLLALLFTTLVGRSIPILALAVGIAASPGFGRIIRRKAIALRHSDFVVSAVTFGQSRIRIVLRHVLPNVLVSVLLLATIEIGSAILVVSGISFVGLGPPRPSFEWGSLVSEGRAVISHAWWPTVFPGLAIVATIVSFTTVGRYLQRRFEWRTQ